MPPSPDDKLSTVRKGVKGLFRSRSQRRNTQGNDDAPSMSQGASSAMAVEAPNSTATPQLTTNIPGASLGADLPPSQPRDVPGTSDTQDPPPPPPIIPRRSYAAGMSATSGPLGGSLEEVEHFEKLQERRASIQSPETTAGSAGQTGSGASAGMDNSPAGTGQDVGGGTGQTEAFSKPPSDEDTKMTDA